MISSLDYLDNDVSNILSVYINTRKNYDNVLKEIEQLIDINIFANYLKSFNACKMVYRISRSDPYFDQVASRYFERNEQHRLKIAYQLLTDDRKTRLLHNWPTKHPYFYQNRRGRDTLIRVSNEDYIIDETKWKLKIFPPDKDKYSINQLSVLKR